MPVTTSAPTPGIAPNRVARASTRSSPVSCGPAVDRDVADAGVEPDRDPPGMQRRELVDDLRVLDRGAADHHAVHAGRESVARVVDRAHAATALHRARHVGADRLDHAEVRVAAVTGGVEVDHVDPARALRGEAARDRDRIVVVDGLGVVVAAAAGARRVRRARRSTGTAPSSCGSTARLRRSCRASPGRSRRSSRGGTAWPTAARARPRPRSAGRTRTTRPRRRRRRARARTCARSSTTRDRAGPRAGARRLRTSSVFHPICGRRTVAGRRVIRPGTTPSPAASGDSSLPSNSICMPTQIPRNGRPSVAASRVDALRDRSRAALACTRRSCRRRAARPRRRSAMSSGARR